MKQYEFDGNSFQDLSGFFTAFGEMINGKNGYFGKDLHSFDDCFFGGFGLTTPCEIIWINSDISKANLGHKCYAEWCQTQIKLGEYPDDEALDNLNEGLKQALNSKGPTMFDLLVESIQSLEKRSDEKKVVKLVLK
tara:strand:+ start:344 stop:751 length:408 start_codon:yes stop_codon:yes gene_type:complete